MGEGFKAVARNGNWGDVENGVTHKGTYGTAWGGYILIEVDDPEAFGRYQAFHLENYAHVVSITFEPAWDMDSAFAERVNSCGKRKSGPSRRRSGREPSQVVARIPLSPDPPLIYLGDRLLVASS